MYHFREEYIIPRSGSIPKFEIPINGIDWARIAKLATAIVRKLINGGLITDFVKNLRTKKIT